MNLPGASVFSRDEEQSLCPVCLARIPARYESVREEGGEVVLQVKRCPQHGVFRTPVWRGAPAMNTWKKPKLATPPAPEKMPLKGCPYDCGLCARHRQHTCTVLLEITARCNLRCAYCFASAGADVHAADPDMETVRHLLRSALVASGPCNVQLSGGEPSMREDLPEIIAAAKELFPFVQLNTNGLRIAREAGYARKLAMAGLDSVFLQFDGTTNAIHTALRGAPLLREKLCAIRSLGEAGIGVVLVPTVVPGVNDGNVGALLRLAAAFSPVVRGLHFQPVSHFGRVPAMAVQHVASLADFHGNEPLPEQRITLPEIMRGLEEQTGGMVAAADFLPPGCEHALCSFHANYMVHEDGRLQRLSVQRTACACEPKPAREGAEAAKAFVKRQWAAPFFTGGAGRPDIPPLLEMLAGPEAWRDGEPQALTGPDAAEGSRVPACGSSTGAGTVQAGTDLDTFLNRAATHMLAVSAMAFQDVWNLDLDRLQGCCIHVCAPDGRLVPFCAWNCTAADGTPLHRTTP